MKQKHKYKVCIYCTTFNHVNYIKDALDGFVMQQTNFPFVAIVHDDASTDGTAAILRQYAEKHPDIIHPIYETENQYCKRDGSLTRIMDAAMADTRAKYYAMCEADDYWIDPQKLQKQVEYMESHPECGLCYTDCNVYYEKQKKYQYEIHKNGRVNIDERNPLNSFGYLLDCTWLWRSNLNIHNTNCSYKILDGALESLYLIAQQSQIHCIGDTPTAVYRRHEGSLTCFTKVDEQRQFTYNKSMFLLRYTFANQFGAPGENMKNIMGGALFDLYPLALKYQDAELLDVFRQYFGDILHTKDVEKLVNDCYTIQKSRSYRLGRLIIRPWTVIKEYIKKHKSVKEV